MSNGSDIEEIKKILASKKSKQISKVSSQKTLAKATMNNISKMDDVTLLEISKNISKIINDKGIQRKQEIIIEEEKIEAAMTSIACPKCGSCHYKKKGRGRTGYTRYLCKDCNKNYTITTNTLLDGSHYSYAFFGKSLFFIYFWANL